MNTSTSTYQNFYFSSEIPQGKSAGGQKKCVNYYPFGLTHRGYNSVVSPISNSIAQRFKFGGKELNDEIGLDWYDISARNYDPALGRWMNLDPLAEEMRRHSPYNYAFNNPIYFIDPDGMRPLGLFDEAKAAQAQTFSGPGPGIGWIGTYGQVFNAIKKRALAYATSRMNGDSQGEAVWNSVKEDVATAADMTPGVGDGKGVIEALTGEDLVTGEELSTVPRLLGAIGLTELRVVGKGVDMITDGGKKLLPNELDVGTYKDLVKAGSKGDNITPHHMPANDFMNANGVSKNDGISMNMEQPHPGKGGRHRQTATYGRKSDKTVSARTSLARDLWDARRIYQRDNLYSPKVREALLKVIRLNKKNHPNLFKK